jgi:hypothetical protein
MTSGRRIDPRLRLVSGQVSSSGPIFAEHVAREGALLNRVAQGNLRDGVTDATIELPRIRSNPTETLQWKTLQNKAFPSINRGSSSTAESPSPP